MFELLKSKLGRTHSYVDRPINKLIHLDVVSRSGAFAMNFKCRLKTLYLLNFAQNINKGLHVTLTRAISAIRNIV